MLTAEKRADSVIRWLERMKKSYRLGQLETAMMDAECARADLEDFLRNSKTFDKVRGKSKKKKFLLTRVAILAILIVMAAVMPLARDEVSVGVVEVVEDIELAVPIIVVREPKITTTATVPPKPKRQPTVKVEKKPTTVKDKPVEVQTKSVAYDKLSSLVQTGKKALRNKEFSTK